MTQSGHGGLIDAKRLDYASLGASISAWVFSSSEMTSLASATARRTKSWTLKSLGISYLCFASFGPLLLIFCPVMDKRNGALIW
jgi:hypothetical protein